MKLCLQTKFLMSIISSLAFDSLSSDFLAFDLALFSLLLFFVDLQECFIINYTLMTCICSLNKKSGKCSLTSLNYLQFTTILSDCYQLEKGFQKNQ